MKSISKLFYITYFLRCVNSLNLFHSDRFEHASTLLSIYHVFPLWLFPFSFFFSWEDLADFYVFLFSFFSGSYILPIILVCAINIFNTLTTVKKFRIRQSMFFLSLKRILKFFNFILSTVYFLAAIFTFLFSHYHLSTK